MIRWTVAGLIVVGLLVGIWIVRPRGGGTVSTTTPEAAGTTTTSESVTTTSASTTTTLDPLQIREVETVEQAEAILRELMFGWFEGIYHEDLSRIRKVVVTEEQMMSAQESFGVEFSREPHLEDISFRGSELLRADVDCVALWTVMELNGFREGEAQNVHVLRWTDGRWQMLSSWLYREDMWESDCESVLSAS